MIPQITPLGVGGAEVLVVAAKARLSPIENGSYCWLEHRASFPEEIIFFCF